MKESAARRRILDVASRLFYEQGYHATGINQIIDEADIARGSLYNHFPSKRHLLAAYITNAEDTWFSKLEDYLGKVPGPKAKLLAIFDFRIERQIATGYGGCQFTKLGAEMPKDDLSAFEMVSRQKIRLRAYIGNLLEPVSIRPSALTREMLGENIFLILEGATMTASLYKDVEVLRRARAVADILIGK